MIKISLKLEPLTSQAFEPFGDVIETDNVKHFSINAGTIERYHDLAKVDVGTDSGGRAIISMACSNELTELPAQVPVVERHPLGSQAFIPMSDSPLFLVVAEPSETVDAKKFHAFVSNGRQGINYRPGVWHMPLIALKTGLKFLVIDRAGPGDNCDEHYFDDVEITMHR